MSCCAGGKRKNKRKRENLPLEDEVFDITLPLPESPPSPSKRPHSRCHYNDVESSPSKKSREGAAAAREPVHFEERGMLFGNATNSKSRRAKDEFDLGENVAASKTTRSLKRQTSKMQVEVVLEPRRRTAAA